MNAQFRIESERVIPLSYQSHQFKISKLSHSMKLSAIFNFGRFRSLSGREPLRDLGSPRLSSFSPFRLFPSFSPISARPLCAENSINARQNIGALGFRRELATVSMTEFTKMQRYTSNTD